ncbi:MAG: 30S ribosomal protein S6 [Clostridia bacterium]|nr:30S ribosomal protein S6 [Clostridia bacterium]
MEKIVHDYETMFIVNATLEEDAMRAIVDKFKALIEANAEITEYNEWGKRKLAYPIDDINDGFYVLVNYKAEASFVAELDRNFNIADGILRSMTIRA